MLDSGEITLDEMLLTHMENTALLIHQTLLLMHGVNVTAVEGASVLVRELHILQVQSSEQS